MKSNIEDYIRMEFPDFTENYNIIYRKMTETNTTIIFLHNNISPLEAEIFYKAEFRVLPMFQTTFRITHISIDTDDFLIEGEERRNLALSLLDNQAAKNLYNEISNSVNEEDFPFREILIPLSYVQNSFTGDVVLVTWNLEKQDLIISTDTDKYHNCKKPPLTNMIDFHEYIFSNFTILSKEDRKRLITQFKNNIQNFGIVKISNFSID